MDYSRSLNLIRKTIGYNCHIDTIDKNGKLVGFFIRNKLSNFFIEIYQTSVNSYTFSVCNSREYFPYMFQLSCSSMKEIIFHMKDYKDYFTLASE